MKNNISFLQFGLGPIGLEALRIALSRPRLKLIGAVDRDPSKIGKDVGDLLGRKPLGVSVVGTLEEAINQGKPDIALHTTSSHISQVREQLLGLARAGIHVVSSTEELLLPDLRWPELAREIDQQAQNSGITILGTGINPGFVMDTLPSILSAVCSVIESVHVRRVVDVAQRRKPLQEKVGTGLTVAEFKKRVTSGNLGHVGLLESAHFIARALGWTLENVRETIDPVIADKRYNTPYFVIEPGLVCGIRHTCRGFVVGQEKILLELHMYVGAQQPHDRILLRGNPPVDCLIEPGIFGDHATAAILVNCIPHVIGARPGLITMMDLPLPHYGADNA